MKMTKLMFVGAVAALLAVSCADKVEKPVEALTPVTFEKVTLEDEFWLPRLKTQKETLVPFSLEKTEPVVENLRRVGNYLKTGKREVLLPLPRYVLRMNSWLLNPQVVVVTVLKLLTHAV